jgi:Resolvase, N terminal domain
VAKPTKSVKAFAYLRTSSAANIGEDKDSGRRQLHAIQAFAKRAGIELVGTFHDEAVKGSDPIDTRPGFAAMLEALEGNGTSLSRQPIGSRVTSWYKRSASRCSNRAALILSPPIARHRS